MKRFQDKLHTPQFLVTTEVVPPKGTDLSGLEKIVPILQRSADAVNVTDGSGAMMRATPLAVSHWLFKREIDPIFQITCRDRNRLALQADLLGASILGVRNILILTGDDPKQGDHPEAKPVFDVTSSQLMQVARQLEEGKDMAGKELTGAPEFCIGAAANPGNPKLDDEMSKCQAKMASGAEFFQTQAVFDIEGFRKFARAIAPLDAKCLAGILLLKSAKMARYMNEHVWGIKVPEALIDRMERAKDLRAECVEIAAELIRGIKDLAAGVHVYPLGWDELIPDVLREAGIPR
ncbi:MAG: methylenetetrahydrofolate reductase [Candidatus Omnitrophica bacterium]|nr:methylenetetrahydrofolate reductase [Candidatus Omnitrophota bacterium]